jgi:hypothetical protein
MVTPRFTPSSDDLFFPSPTSRQGFRQQRPDDEVPILTSRAQVESLAPVLSNFLSINRDPFLQVFDRQIQLIRSRSQAFEDGHVTVYDKVLLNLTQNGTNLDQPSAIQYYCEQFLGLNVHGDPKHTFEALDQTVQVQSILRQGEMMQMNLFLAIV